MVQWTDEERRRLREAHEAIEAEKRARRDEATDRESRARSPVAGLLTGVAIVIIVIGLAAAEMNHPGGAGDLLTLWVAGLAGGFAGVINLVFVALAVAVGVLVAWAVIRGADKR